MKSQSLDDLEPHSIKQVGGVVFPDTPARQDLNDFNAIIKAYRDVHLPTYGVVIPNSSSYNETSISSATTTKILTPGVNEVLEIQALELTSAEAGTSVVFRLQVDSNDLVISGDVELTQSAPTAIFGINVKQNALPFEEKYTIAYPYSLAIQTLSSGTVDLAVKILSSKTMQ